MSDILAIDPGTEQSGWAYLRDHKIIVGSGVCANDDILEMIYGTHADQIAIEMIASYGMPVGREVFETCVWIGRFVQLRSSDTVLVYRQNVKLALCGSPKAKDANIRQAIIDKLGPQGTAKNKGPTYGVKSHAWAALGVALCVAERPKS